MIKTNFNIEKPVKVLKGFCEPDNFPYRVFSLNTSNELFNGFESSYKSSYTILNFDSNLLPVDIKNKTLKTLIHKGLFKANVSYREGDLNPRPADYDSDALTN